MNQQLALTIQPNEQATFADFYWGDNLALQAHLEASLAGKGESQIYLWGREGAGKSHVLQACCHRMEAQYPVIYLPLKTLHVYGPEVIEGLDAQKLLCIDDVDAIAGDMHWEEALFHLYNRIRDQGTSVLIFAGLNSPRNNLLQLPDLKSRLAASLVIQLHELTDEIKVDVIRHQAHKRGLELPLSVGQFLVNRCARNMHDLHALLNRLDQASWVAQRKLTIPFIKAILEI
jgi:DnaA family protein